MSDYEQSQGEVLAEFGGDIEAYTDYCCGEEGYDTMLDNTDAAEHDDSLEDNDDENDAADGDNESE